MAIRKGKYKNNYTVIPNKPLRDRSLSWKAKGLLSFLLSLDDGWVIHKKDLSSRSSDGYDSTSSSFNELVSAGYIIDRGRERRSDGLFGDNLYEVYDSPQKNEKPNVDKPDTENPELDNPHIRSTTIPFMNSSTELEKEITLKINPESVDSGDQSQFLSEEKPLSLYRSMVDFWLKEFHPGWMFKSIHGQKIKSIISSFRSLHKQTGRQGTDEEILTSFKYMCINLPEFYKDKDLQVIDSKFNEIITEIKKGKNGKQSNYQNARNAFSEFA